MLLAANTVVALIALLHVYILVLEMFLWDKPAGLRAFGMKQDLATATRVLGANQGLYNGFLAAGLFWGLWLGDAGLQVKDIIGLTYNPLSKRYKLEADVDVNYMIQTLKEA